MINHRNSVKSTSTIYFENLDGLRVVAFLMVYFNHSLLGDLKNLYHNAFAVNGFNILMDGATGVSIFFVLSGFLITYLILYEIKLRGKFNIRYFYARRILRIWPLYYAVVIISVIIQPALKLHFGHPEDSIIRPFYYFAFLSNFEIISFPKQILIRAITWSVSVEEQFYLIWPLLFLFISKRYFFLLFACVIVCCLLFRTINYRQNLVMNFHSLSICADLAVGGISAYYCIYSLRFTNFFKNLKKPVIAGTYVLCFSWLYLNMNFLNSYFSIYARLISTLFFAFIILEQNYCSNSFYKFSCNKVLTSLGKYTYGFYLLHPIALWMFEVLEFKTLSFSIIHNAFYPFIRDIAGLFLTFLISYISYHFYEKRFLKLKDKISFIK